MDGFCKFGVQLAAAFSTGDVKPQTENPKLCTLSPKLLTLEAQVLSRFRVVLWAWAYEGLRLSDFGVWGLGLRI